MGGGPGGPFKTDAKQRENESQRDHSLPPGVPRHQGNQRKPIIPSRIKGKLINTHQNTSRNHQGSSTISQNHFHSIWQNKGKHQTTRARTPARTGPDPGALITEKTSDRITHPGPIKISRSDSPPNLRYTKHQAAAAQPGPEAPGPARSRASGPGRAAATRYFVYILYTFVYILYFFDMPQSRKPTMTP